jgi:TPP-dependent trihydroxycyclohexane-1,2-dione (THcHDO) dehydratase
LFCLSVDDFERALEEARRQDRTTAIVVEVDKEARGPGYASWCDVPVAEASESSESEAVQRVCARYEKAVRNERFFL